MLQDLMAGRKTEIDVLCGAVISKGEEVGVPTPRNEILMALVRDRDVSEVRLGIPLVNQRCCPGSKQLRYQMQP